MALPPILTNLPFTKLFRTEQAPETDGKQAAPAKKEKESAPSSPQDIVEISEAALKKLEGQSSFLTEDEAKAAAGETRGILEKNPGVALGLEEGFS